MIDTIMLFAAGLGNRMRHLSENNPKSLINILNKPILFYALELCKNYPFKKIIINTHYLSKQINEAIALFQSTNPSFPEINIVYEEELLETGGAVKNAYQQGLINDLPIFALNTDVIIRPKTNIFAIMQQKWQPELMDFLLLMQPFAQILNQKNHGDFDLTDEGKLIRPDKIEDYHYIYTGLQILNPEKVAKNPQRIFSLREYYLNSDRVIGLPAPNTDWYHASAPEDLIDIEMHMLNKKN